VRRPRQRGGTCQRSFYRIKAAELRSTRQTAAPNRARDSVPDRNGLLLGTALASTLLIGALVAPAPAHAVVTCAGDAGLGPTPISHLGEFDSIVCVNTEPRTAVGAQAAIDLSTTGDDFPVILNSEGRLQATNAGLANGIRTTTVGERSDITIENRGDIGVVAEGANAHGIFAFTLETDSPIEITHRGDVTVSSDTSEAYGVYAYSVGSYSPLSITIDSGHFAVRSDDGDARGILARTGGTGSDVELVNHADIRVTSSSGIAAGISVQTYDTYSPVSITNSGDITAKGVTRASGIHVATTAPSNPTSIVNSGNITATANNYAYGVFASGTGYYSGITVVNRGNITVKAQQSYGIAVRPAYGDVVVRNSGNITAQGNIGGGIRAEANYGSLYVSNSGDIVGSTIGILATAEYGVTVVNRGSVTADSLFAIEIVPAYGDRHATLVNYGKITGYIEVFGSADQFLFTNKSGGRFEARRTSLFGGGALINEAGGVVHTANDPAKSETTNFSRISVFQNKGRISMVDGSAGDRFHIYSNDGTYASVNDAPLVFTGDGNSTLAVDAFLGGPRSASDIFIIDGEARGTTRVEITNTNTGGGLFNPGGIPIVFVNGATPNPNAFTLDQPIDAGLFNYDLYFTPTGSGYWSLRSFPGGGAFLLPQLVTAAQDVWHQSSSTWFDRTADLRVLLNGGLSPTAYDPDGKSLSAAGPYPLTPAVWARGSGGWLDRDGTARTTAYGRDYTFDMDRDLETLDFQVGVDMGKRDVMSQGDALVFGLLGGFVHGDLDYDALARAFNFDGGQVGAYATYLNGALFVDTLLNVHLYSLDTNTLGFPDSLDANTVGLRTDTGYRFGSFSGGPFLEPLATIDVTWADIDGFSLDGNTVSFGDDANVRGRLGLRAGTTTEAWDGTLMEPFVTGSLWGNLTDDNSATLVSTGRTFRFEDQLQDVWGEISAGVNFFNVSQTTAVFAKVDVTFGDDLTGLGGKAGMRVNW
jgi:Autotransporter beta-domain/Autochaperone Domain Type 1